MCSPGGVIPGGVGVYVFVSETVGERRVKGTGFVWVYMDSVYCMCPAKTSGPKFATIFLLFG